MSSDTSSRQSSPSTSSPPKQKSKQSASNERRLETDRDSTVQILRNEGDDPNWAYVPPSWASPIDNTSVDVGDFDWSSVNKNDNAELWLIRIPEGVKPHVLEAKTIRLPNSHQSTRVGTISRKRTTYDIWSIGSDVGVEDDDVRLLSGEEITSLSCLLPRKSKKGKLYLAPKPVARHLVLSAQPARSATLLPDATTYQNPPRHAYPQELLTHVFVPYGALSSDAERAADTGVEDADVEMAAVDVPLAKSPRKSKEKRVGNNGAEKKTKKRRMEDAMDSGDGEKKAKAKKRKTAATAAIAEGGGEALLLRKHKKHKVSE
ncbi:hypothetical protein FISHEDRAFT_66462 [Fistulina hepatica ATCC 64428]|uniref:Uncharacterized protein n=1 Tax=Fistulina hepatica ATCC 64428 TaxID=1128425 RepID=A0A0D7A6L1_9AGAR|nr:hypothetical protein FISHEDRAFT_66462 [Fistulina hepatica ATCC 64428]